jgi:hypothetical protein
MIVGELSYSLDGIPLHGVIMGHTRYDSWNFGEYGGRYNFYLSNSSTTNALLIARIDTNNNYLSGSLGIGTTSPAYKLDVNGTFHATGLTTLGNNLLFSNGNGVYGTRTNGNTGEIISFASDNTVSINKGFFASGDWTKYYGTKHVWFYGITAVTGMFLDSTGYLGIGTTSPAYKLDVNGTLHASGAATLDSTLKVSGQISVPSGVNINLKGPSDSAHYIRNFNDDTDGFGVSVGFSVKNYNNLSGSLFSVSAKGLATISSAYILGDAQLSAMVKSPDYVSQTTGWGITRAGAADFRSVYADTIYRNNFAVWDAGTLYRLKTTVDADNDTTNGVTDTLNSETIIGAFLKAGFTLTNIGLSSQI